MPDTANPLRSVVLSAGKGTRISPLSDERPKSLIPTLDVSNLARAVLALEQAGASPITVNTHDHSDLVMKEVKRLEAISQVVISHEEKAPLGTAGALRKLQPMLADEFVIHNGDIVCGPPIRDLLEVHRSSGAAVTMMIVPNDERTDVIIEEGWVTHLPLGGEREARGWLYGGICVVDKKVIDYIPEGTSGLVETVFQGVLSDDSGIAAYEYAGYWNDVGTVEAHLRANLDALAGSIDDNDLRVMLLPPPERIDSYSYVGAGVFLDDVEMRHAVVGSGAEVAPGCRLERCVVWSGSKVKKGDYKDCVITPKKVVKAKR